MSNEVLKDWLNKEDKPDLFTIILTSVGTEIIAFRKSTKKITKKDDDFLTNAITKRIMRYLEDDKLIPSPSGSEALPSSTPQSVDKEAILSKFKTFSNYYNQEGYETEDVITAMDEYAAENEELIIEMRKEYDQAVDKINQLKSSNKAKEKEIERLKGLIETLHTEAFGINPVKWLQFKAENNL